MPLSPDLFALVVAVVVFLSGLVGLYLRSWQPRSEGADETRDLINRMSGLIATMSALVLGLLIASANSFYNSQKAGLEMVSAGFWSWTACCAATAPRPNRHGTC
jgi:type II secretory pathway component PulM